MTTNLLITGGAGFVGSNFIRYWLNEYPKDLIVNLDLLTYAGDLDSLQDVKSKFPQNYQFIQGDIANQELVTYLLQSFKIDIIVNFAAESHNSRAIVNPSIFLETNTLGTQKLLEAAKNVGVKRFHHISTCEVYGDLPLDSKESFTEESPFRPRTPYNASKAAADIEVKAYYHTFDIPITISNCANNYGPYQFPEKLIPYFITKAYQGEEMPLYKSSKNKREWLHVDDHCRAIDLVLTKGEIGETYNIGSGIEADVETIADKILAVMKLDQSYKTYVPDRPSHDRRYLLNSSKIRNQLGWKPQVEFEQGLSDTINWYLENPKWWEPLLKKLEIQESKWK